MSFIINPYRFATGGGSLTNWAASANGGTASASSTAGGYLASSAINGLRHTNNDWGGSSGGWSSLPGSPPHTLTVDLAAEKIIEEIRIYTLKDTVNYSADPSESDTFTLYGVTNFTIDLYYSGSWNTIETISGNNLVVIVEPVASIAATKARVVSSDSTARIIEFEVWGA